MNYMIPANTKRSQLIFNMFRPIDLVVAGSGAIVSLILLLAISTNTLLLTIVKLAPIVICALLVTPIANYHNAMVFIRELYLFYSNRRIYMWKGWCIRSEYEQQKD